MSNALQDQLLKAGLTTEKKVKKQNQAKHKKIKSQNDMKDIPVYYITAVPENEVSERLRDTGAENYIQKDNEEKEIPIALKINDL